MKFFESSVLALLLLSLACAQNTTMQATGTIAASSVLNTTVATTAAPTTTPVPTTLAPATPLDTKVYVVARLDSDKEMMEATARAALEQYVRSLISASTSTNTRVVQAFFDAGGQNIDTVFINSKGSAAEAVATLEPLLRASTAAIDIVIVVDLEEVVYGVELTLRGMNDVVLLATKTLSIENTAVPFVSLLTDSSRRTPIVLATVETLKWESVIILSGSDIGTSAAATSLMNTFNNPTIDSRTRIVGSFALSSSASATDDDNVLAAMRQLRTAAVVVVGGDAVMTRIRAAANRYAARTGSNCGLYWLQIELSARSYLYLDSGSFSSSVFTDAAILTIDYTQRTEYPQSLTASVSGITPAGSYVLSFLLDALRVVASAVAVPSTIDAASMQQNLLKVSFSDGFTGPVSFDTNGYRSAPRYVLQAKNSELFVITYNVNGVLTFMPNVIDFSAFVPSSPLRAVQVCLLAGNGCPEAASLYWFQRTFLNYSFAWLRSQMTMSTVIASTQDNAVQGMKGLMDLGRSCTFLVGPGVSSLTFAISPIVNAFGTPQLDYGSNPGALSNKVQYPYFSRTIPTILYQAKAAAAAFSSFAWDRVAIIATYDTYGESALQQVTLGLASVGLVIEKSYSVSPQLVESELRDALADISTNLITRIVVVLLGTPSATAASFFKYATDAKMQTTHLFMFDDALCQYAIANPAVRLPFIGSMCVVPAINATSSGLVANQTLAADATITARLKAAGIDTTKCIVNQQAPHTGYATDAALLLLQSLNNAVTNQLNFFNKTALLYGLRSTTYPGGLTGDVVLDPLLGDRKDSSYIINIQQDFGVVNFATWSPGKSFNKLQLASPLRWLDNTTAIPKASTRSIGFIATRTAKSSTSAVVISILGFAITIGVFVFCYRAQKAHDLTEKAQALPGGPAA